MPRVLYYALGIFLISKFYYLCIAVEKQERNGEEKNRSISDRFGLYVG